MPTLTPNGGVDHRVAVAAQHVLALEGVQLAVTGDGAVGLAEDVGIVEPAVRGAFDQADADRHVEFARQRQRLQRRGAVGNRLGQRLDLRPIEVAHVPVAGDAHLGKGEDLDARRGGLARQALDDREVVGLVVGAVVELRRSQLQLHRFPLSR